MEKCENCGGDGLISQGDSIKFTCSVCMGSGKAVEEILSESVSSTEAEIPVIETDSSFSVESGEVGEVPEGSGHAPVLDEEEVL